jgi:outer membrane murein-binding lipoprotein Lpp
MSTQAFMWPFSLFAPGNLNQPILPGWSFGNISVNYAGNADIEKDVVEKVASFGKQLGIITEAVLALSDGKSKDNKAVTRLRDLAAKIEQLKNQNKASLADQARGAMQRLEKAEPATARRIATEFAKP